VLCRLAGIHGCRADFYFAPRRCADAALARRSGLEACALLTSVDLELDLGQGPDRVLALSQGPFCTFTGPSCNFLSSRVPSVIVYHRQHYKQLLGVCTLFRSKKYSRGPSLHSSTAHSVSLSLSHTTLTERHVHVPSTVRRWPPRLLRQLRPHRGGLRRTSLIPAGLGHFHP
jgi:hypothetical protein